MSDPDKLSKAIKIRNKIKKRPDFVRQEAGRFPRLGDKWRGCTGIRSKMRLKKKGRPAIVETGYRSPVLARGIHPSGKREVLVYNVEDLNKIKPSTNIIRIASAVGKRKRLEILKRAETLGIIVVNIRPSEKPEEKPVEVKEEEEAKEEAAKEPEAEEEAEEEGWSPEKEEREAEGSR